MNNSFKSISYTQMNKLFSGKQVSSSSSVVSSCSGQTCVSSSQSRKFHKNVIQQKRLNTTRFPKHLAQELKYPVYLRKLGHPRMVRKAFSHKKVHAVEEAQLFKTRLGTSDESFQKKSKQHETGVKEIDDLAYKYLERVDYIKKKKLKDNKFYQFLKVNKDLDDGKTLKKMKEKDFTEFFSPYDFIEFYTLLPEFEQQDLKNFVFERMRQEILSLDTFEALSNTPERIIVDRELLEPIPKNEEDVEYSTMLDGDKTAHADRMQDKISNRLDKDAIDDDEDQYVEYDQKDVQEIELKRLKKLHEMRKKLLEFRKENNIDDDSDIVLPSMDAIRSNENSLINFYNTFLNESEKDDLSDLNEDIDDVKEYKQFEKLSEVMKLNIMDETDTSLSRREKLMQQYEENLKKKEEELKNQRKSKIDYIKEKDDEMKISRTDYKELVQEIMDDSEFKKVKSEYHVSKEAYEEKLIKSGLLEKEFKDESEKSESELSEDMDSPQTAMEKKSLEKLQEIYKSMLTKKGIEQLLNSLNEMYDVAKKEIENKHISNKESKRSRMAHMIPAAAAEKMWQLHQENPHYWTGERLGKLFGLPRERAWGELLMRERRDSLKYGLPFSFKKSKIIFAREHRKFLEDMGYRKKSNHLKKRPDFTNILEPEDEDELYLKFIERSTQESNLESYDDNLPEWVKIPFQTEETWREQIDNLKIPTPIENKQEKTEEYRLFPNPLEKLGYGTLKSHHNLTIAELKNYKKVPEEERMLLFKEKGEKLRGLTSDEKRWVYRTGTMGKSRFGLGQKKKRKSMFNKFDFSYY